MNLCALWRRITRLPHKRLQIHLCVEMQRINGFTPFMRWKSTHKGKIAYMRHNCAFCRFKRLSYRCWRKRNFIVLLDYILLCHVFPQRIEYLNLELFNIGLYRRGQYVHPPSAIMSVCPPVRQSVSSSDFVSAITFNTIKGMWIKPGMWQYVDYARISSSHEHEVLIVSYCGGWLFVVRRRVSCVVNVLSVDTLGNPIVMKLVSRQYLGQVLIWQYLWPILNFET